MRRSRIKCGDSLKELAKLPDNSIDSLITDPPAGINFMGKGWDSNKGGRDKWIAWLADIMKEAYRVMKPGAHGFVWALPRTCGWTQMALEEAGFEVRDAVGHITGQGFPKSHNVNKALEGVVCECDNKNMRDMQKGLGTALKPAIELWFLIRKPFKGTVAQNVLKHGTGAINIDASRVRIEGKDTRSAGHRTKTFGKDGEAISGGEGSPDYTPDPQGRFPANVVLSCSCEEPHQPDCVCAALDEQSCGASRFFYCAKVSTKERNMGMDKKETNGHPTVKPIKLMTYLITMITPPGGWVLDPFAGSGSTLIAAKKAGFKYVGIEREKDYVAIARRRLR